MELYREIILDHYRDPRNRGHLSNPDRTGKALNPACGDELVLELKFTDGKVTEVGFSGNGCAVSQASASLLTETMKGKTEKELRALGKDQVFQLLGGPVNPGRERCAFLVLSGLDQALKQ